MCVIKIVNLAVNVAVAVISILFQNCTLVTKVSCFIGGDTLEMIGGNPHEELVKTPMGSISKIFSERVDDEDKKDKKKGKE